MAPNKQPKRNSPDLYTPKRITLTLLRELDGTLPPKVKGRDDKLKDSAKEIRDTADGLILRHQPSGYLGLYVQLGRGKRERLCDVRDIINPKSTITMKKVRAKARGISGQHVNGRDFAGERKAARSVPSLKQFLKDDYGPWALKHLKDGQGALDRLDACFEKFMALKLTEIDKRRVRKWREGREVSAHTVNRDVSALSAVMRYAVDEEVIAEHPFKGLKSLKANDDKTVRALEQDEETRLREALKARDDKKRAGRASGNTWRRERGYEELPAISAYADHLTPAVITSLETGLRRNELLSLDWRFVDFKKKEIHVQWKTAKTDRSRVIPMNPCAVETLRAWWMQCKQPKEGLVFSGAKGKLSSLKKSYHAILKAAKIPRVDSRGMRVNWHSLRHSFGTRLGAANIDPVTIQRLMGHRSLTTTSRYLHSEPDRMRAAVEKLAAN